MPAALALPTSAHRLLADLCTHDHATWAHSLAVGRYAARLASAIAAPTALVAHVTAVGTMHDIGKLAVPLPILTAAHALSADEARVMREHADLGATMLEADAATGHLAQGVRLHHERLDGFGYPYALAGDAIPLEARIVAVADTFDALVRGRPYRPPIPATEALAILGAAAGRQLDGAYVAAFVRLIDAEGPEPVTLAERSAA